MLPGEGHTMPTRHSTFLLQSSHGSIGTIPAVFEDVEKGLAQYGVVPKAHGRGRDKPQSQQHAGEHIESPAGAAEQMADTEANFRVVGIDDELGELRGAGGAECGAHDHAPGVVRSGDGAWLDNG
jgi:hypothetical protein